MRKYRVEESKKRSILKSLTASCSEIFFDVILFSFLLQLLGIPHLESIGMGLGISLMDEAICCLTFYFNERVWNRLQFGRRIVSSKERRKKNPLKRR